jgi:hypothetical protein
MSKQWQRGFPKSPGWYPCQLFGHGQWHPRWYDGVGWSYAVSVGATAQQAGRIAADRALPSYESYIQWRKPPASWSKT